MHSLVKRLAAGSIVTAALLLMIGGAYAAAMPDRIIKHSGEQIRGVQITEAKVTGVRCVQFGGTKKYPLVPFDQIKEIRWGDARQFNKVISDVKTGRWKDALKNLKSRPQPAPRDFWYGPYKRVLHGKCLLETGDPAAALKMLDEVIQTPAYSDSFYLLEAILGKARAHTALKQYAEAARTYAGLDPKGSYTDPTATAPYGQMWQLRGRVEMAGALAKAKRYPEAEETYEGLAKVTEAILADPPRGLKAALKDIAVIYQTSLVGKAEVQMATGKLVAARKWIDAIAPKLTSRGARLKMYVALGDLAKDAAEKARDKTEKRVQLKRAVLSYMRVYILYPDQTAMLPRAMFGAAAASVRLGSRDDRRRAIQLYRQLIARFPNSDEATEAKRGLEGLNVE